MGNGLYVQDTYAITKSFEHILLCYNKIKQQHEKIQMEEKSEITAERPIILFNCIDEDGIGDFSHFEDIVKALREIPRFHQQKFIAFVGFDPNGKKENYDRIKDRLSHLDIEFYYGTYDELDQQFADLSAIITPKLEQASQAIVISFNSRKSSTFTCCSVWMRNLDTPPKFLGEHEANSLRYDGNYLSRSLGLSEHCYGLKIKNVPSHLAPEDAWETIQHADSAFFEQLLTQTHSTDVHEFVDNNILFPAYFNRLEGLLRFLIFLDKCPSIDINISIYCSGLNFEMFSDFEQDITECNEHALRRMARSALDKWPFAFLAFKETDIKGIEIISPSHELKYIELNPSGSKTIKLFSEYYISKPSYEALYHLAPVAGVSGDNTLEFCLSLGVLPYYHSTNFAIKAPTLHALREITQLPQLNISDEAREAFNHFFDSNARLYEKTFELSKMLEAWPIVIDYLKQHMNFYNQLESIMLEGIVPHVKPLAMKTIMQNIQQLSKSTEYKKHFFSHKDQPKTTDDEHGLPEKNKPK